MKNTNNQSSTSDRLAEDTKRQEELVLKLEPTVFQVANYNFVFQGVILTAAIHGASILEDCFFWFPLCLSLIGSILNFCTLLVLSTKYIAYLDILDKKACICYTANNKPPLKSGEKSPQPRRGEKKVRQQNEREKHIRKIFFYSAMLLFVVFSLVMAVATVAIPCLLLRKTNKL